MTKRKQFRDKMDAIEKKMSDLHIQYIEWQKRNLLLSDKTQQFKEAPETHGRGKNKATHLIGRIHWKEDYKDEDTGEVITIERSHAIQKDGEWIVKLGLF